MATWLEDVTAALESIGGQGPLEEIYNAVKERRPNGLPQRWQAIVRKELEYNSSDSEADLGKRDLFYSVVGIGKDIWGLRASERVPEVAGDVDEPNPGRVETRTNRILRDTKLARRLKRLHKDRCQICNLALEIRNGETYSEAHHVRPLGGPHNGPDLPENIVVLCPNHHAAMDLGAFKISRSTFRISYGHSLAERFIHYHNEVIVEGKQQLSNQVSAPVALNAEPRSTSPSPSDAL